MDVVITMSSMYCSTLRIISCTYLDAGKPQLTTLVSHSKVERNCTIILNVVDILFFVYFIYGSNALIYDNI